MKTNLSSLMNVVAEEERKFAEYGCNVNEYAYFYSSVKELKEFYNENRDRINIEDEYGEEQDIDELFEFIDMKYKDKNNQSHTDAYKDKQGYEWISNNFS